MQAVELATPVAGVAPKLMASEVIAGGRVCDTDDEIRESDHGSTFPGPKTDEFDPLLCHRGTSNTSESPSWIKKADTETCRSNGSLCMITKVDASMGLDHGIDSSSVALISVSGRQTSRKVGKVPRNGSGSFRKVRMLQTDNLLTQAEADDTKMELDKLGPHLLKCLNADKSVAVKQKSSVNGKRGDRRNHKVQMKAKYDPFSLKAGLPSFNLASGGSHAFGMYGLKPDIHDVTKLIDDISLDELLDGNFKYPTQGKDKGKKASNVHENIHDSVRKACSVLRLQGFQQGNQTDEVDVHASQKFSSLSSPSNANDDESSLTAGLSKSSRDLMPCTEAETPADMNDCPLYGPTDVLERLSLPPSKDLDSLLQDAVKPATSGRPTDLRSAKPLSNRVTLPPFPWSSNFNGHYKSNNDAIRISNKSACQGRWLRIKSSTCFIGGRGNESFVDLESLTYDGSLVPAGQVKYRLPEFRKTSPTCVGQDFCSQDPSSAVCSTATLLAHESGGTSSSKMNAWHSPLVLVAAQTLCDFASSCTRHKMNGIMKWPKQPSQKLMTAHNTRSSEKSQEDFLTPKSETVIDHVVRGFEFGPPSKKPKISVIERREEFSHVQAVLGLSSVSASRSSRVSPLKLSRDSVAEARQYNKSFSKPSFMVPLPPRAMDRSNHNPQKLRKVGPTDWNRARS